MEKLCSAKTVKCKMYFKNMYVKIPFEKSNGKNITYYMKKFEDKKEPGQS